MGEGGGKGENERGEMEQRTGEGEKSKPKTVKARFEENDFWLHVNHSTRTRKCEQKFCVFLCFRRRVDE